MFYHDLSEQVFDDKIIGIDWSKNEDKAIHIMVRKEKDGTVTFSETIELDKG